MSLPSYVKIGGGGNRPLPKGKKGEKMVKGYNAQEADRYFTEPPEPTQVAGSGNAKIILTCDIEYMNKIVFENTDVYFMAMFGSTLMVI